MALAGTLWVNITANASGLANGVRQANQAVAGFGQHTRRIGRSMMQLGDNMFNFAENFTQGMTVAVAGLLGIAVYAAAQTAKGKTEIDKLKDSWNSLLKAIAPVGIVLLQMANVIAPIIVEAFQKMNDWFMSLSKTGQWVTVAIMIFLGVLGPLVMFTAAVIMLMGGLAQVFGALFTPVTLVVWAIISFSMAMAFLFKTNSDFREAIFRIWAEIRAWWFQFFDPILQWCITNWPLIKETIINAWKAIWTTVAPIITQLVNWITQGLAAVREWIIANWPAIKNTMISVWQFIESTIIPIVQNIAKWIIEKMGETESWFSKNWPKIKETAIKVWNGIVAFLKPIVMDVVNFLIEIWDDFAQFWDEHGSKIVKAAQVYWDVLKTFIVDTVNNIWNFFKMIWPAISQLIQAVWAVIKTTVMLAIDFIQMIIATVCAAISGDWTKVWTSIQQFSERFWTLLEQIVAAAFVAIWSAIQVALAFVATIFTQFCNTTKAMWNTFWNTIKKTLEKINLGDIGTRIMQGLANGISSGIGKVKSAISKLAGLVPKWAKDILGINSPSRVMMEVGAYTGQGMEVGILNSIRAIKKASASMASSAVPKIDSNFTAPGNIPVMRDNSSRGPVFNIAEMNVRDESDIKKIAYEFHVLSQRGARSVGGAIF